MNFYKQLFYLKDKYNLPTANIDSAVVELIRRLDGIEIKRDCGKWYVRMGEVIAEGDNLIHMIVSAAYAEVWDAD